MNTSTIRSRQQPIERCRHETTIIEQEGEQGTPHRVVLKTHLEENF